MHEIIEFLIRHGYWVLFGFVFSEQLGLPIPAIPILLAAGALSKTGELSSMPSTLVAVIASLASDTLWYAAGRRRGGDVLRWLCRISLEPDSCVRKTEDLFSRHGSRSLLIAKFVPGLSTIAPPLAGVTRMKLLHFIVYDFLGSFLWSSVFIACGYFFSHQLEEVAAYAIRFGLALMIFMLLALAGYIVWKYVRRHQLLDELAVPRISTEELNAKMERGEDVFIVDLRHSMEFASNPATIPRALHLPIEDFDQRQNEIPRDREIVLFCT